MSRPAVPVRPPVAALTALAVLTALSVGCTRVPDGTGALAGRVDASVTEPGPSGTAADSTEADDVSPSVTWVPGPGEVSPEVKTAATRFVELAGTWDDGAGTPQGMTERLAAGSLPGDLAASAGQLGHPGASHASIEVLYPQYGGLTADEASVMVLVRQDLRLEGGTTSRQLMLDVRVGRDEGGGWQVTGIATGNPPAPAGAVSELAARVLAHPNINLPGPGRADIEAGYVQDSILTVLERVAQDRVIDVHAVQTGHPVNIFDTDRNSQHTLGRAVDIWRIDGKLVVDPATPRDLLVEVMSAAGPAGATEVGGPFDLNGPRRGYFTDAVHSDHLHLAVTPGRSPAVP